MKALKDYEAYNCENWDGYGAVPVTPETLATARLLAEMLDELPLQVDPAPGGDGSICFELTWADGRELWLDVTGTTIEGYLPKRPRISIPEQ